MPMLVSCRRLRNTVAGLTTIEVVLRVTTQQEQEA